MGRVDNLDELTRLSNCLVCKRGSVQMWFIVVIIGGGHHGAVPLTKEVGQQKAEDHKEGQEDPKK